MKYRREIDGLRAVAIIPVILFHAGFPAFGGGFVGVDVFFVISGYLITSIILAEKEAGVFSIVDFYERRARRILPALVLVVFLSSVCAWVFLLPAALRDYSQSLMAVSVFVSNLFFWSTSGYFETDTALKPLIHTWSLAVEEQYYLLFPVFLVFAWRLGRRWVVGALVLVAIISLAAAHVGSLKNPTATFFLLPTRIWELLLGALIAFYFLHRGERANSPVLSMVGILLISYAVCFFDKSTPFPSLYALVPTLGASLVILFCTSQSLVGKVLGSKLFVGIGLISYSLYLWHQPLFAFAKYVSLEGVGRGLSYVLIAATLFFAYLSWRFVEAPFRGSGRFNRRQIFSAAFFVTLLSLAVGLFGYANNGFTSRLPPNVEWESLGNKLRTTGDICVLAPLAGVDGVDACYFGDKNSKKIVALYGDSHAQAISSELNRSFFRDKIKGIRVSARGCDFIPRVFDSRYAAQTDVESCDKSFKSLLGFLDSIGSEVVVIGRWTFRLYPISGEIEALSFDNKEGGVEWNENREYVAVQDNGDLGYGFKEKRMAIEQFIESMGHLNSRVVVVYPVPEVGWDIARANMISYKSNGKILAELSTSYDEYKKRNNFIIEAFESKRWSNNVAFVKPQKLLCDTFIAKRCAAQHDGVPFYFDDDHLSDAGARLVVNEVTKYLSK